MKIDNVAPALASQLAQSALRPSTGAVGTSAFAQMLDQALQSVDSRQTSAEQLARAFQSEDSAVTLEEAMIAMQKANISFQTMVQVRNRLVSAYHDVMNMQV